MSLVNVEKIEAQEKHEKTWFQRCRNKFAVGASALSALAVSTASNAFLTSADVTSATTSAGGEEVLKTGAVWVISIVVGMAVVGLVIALIKKK